MPDLLPALAIDDNFGEEVGKKRHDDKFLDICRVCRGEATEKSPLFYPCLCSGSIKYVHQECLVEWLKHSKKRICELCKHSFAFSPIYKEQMPKHLPLSIILFGILKQMWKLVKGSFRIVLAMIVWIVLVPYFSAGFPLRYYILGKIQSNATIVERMLMRFVDCVLGIALTGMVLLLGLGILLLRDYMRSNGMLRQRRNRNDIPHQVIIEQQQQQQDNIEEIDNILSDMIGNIEAQSNTNNTNINNNNGNGSGSGDAINSNIPWFSNVSPREYRAYLRRRELYREKQEKEQIQQQEALKHRNALMLRNVTDNLCDADALISKATNISSALQSNQAEEESIFSKKSEKSIIFTAHATTTEDHPSRKSMSIRNYDYNSPSNGNGMAITTNAIHNGVTFREISIRCRICDSKTCTSREHVIQASRSRIQAQQQLPKVIQLPSTIPPEQQQQQPLSSPAATTPAMQQPIVPAIPIVPQPPVVNNQGWLDADAPNISIGEFFGFSGPWLNLAQNSCIVFLCNLLFLHAILFWPQIIGRFVLNIDFGFLFSDGEGLYDHLAPRVQHFLEIVSKNFSNIVRVLLGDDFIMAFIDAFSIKKDSVVYFGVRIFIGYALLITFGLFEYSIMSRMYPNSEFVQRCVLMGSCVKFVFVLSLEMIVFPLVLGIVLDLCTLKLFAKTMIDRLQFHARLAILSFILHWSFGVCFMVGLASFVHYIRQSLRPGLLHFIRNPHDPEYRPVRDMIELPIFKHFRKIAFSLVFYTFFCIFFFYSSTILIRKFASNIIPIHMGFRESHGELPFELFLNVILNRIVWWMKPMPIVALVKKGLKRLLRILRLSSFIRGGGRYLDEEIFGSKGGKWIWVPDYDRLYKREKLAEMLQKPVDPASVAKMTIMEGIPNQITINATTTLMEEHPMKIGRKMPAKTYKGFTIAYMPSNFRLRIMALFGAIWTIYQLTIFLFSVLPIIIGRWSFGLIFNGKVNDIYSFFVGFLMITVVIRAVDALAKALINADKLVLRNLLIAYPIKVIQLVFSIFIIFGLWPLLLGLYLLMLILPWTVQPNKTPVLYPISLWTCGLTCLKLIFTARRYILSPERNQIIRELKNNGWNVSFQRLLSVLILPYTLRLLIFTLSPPFLVRILAPIFYLSQIQTISLQRWSYSLTLMIPLIILSIQSLEELRRRLITGIRDEEYLLGRQLRNYQRRMPSLNNTNNNNNNNKKSTDENSPPINAS